MRVLLPTLCLIFGSVLLFQCGDEEDTPLALSPEVEVAITAEKTTVTFPSKGGDYEVKITSSGDWDVKEEVSWLEAIKMDNTLLKVTCEENTGASRSDKITATIEEEAVEITVTQSADTQPSFGAKTIADQTYLENRPMSDLTLPLATGGNGTLSYSLTQQDGSILPAWLMFTSDTRVLSGITPSTSVNTATRYVYIATDSDGDASMLTFMIAVEADVPPTFGSETISDQTYVVNSPMTLPAFPLATEGNGLLSYSLTRQDESAMPAWLIFREDTRVLSGTTPATPVSTATYIYRVTDSDGDEERLTFTITVSAEDLIPGFAPDDRIAAQTYLENSPITALRLPVATDGNGALSYSVTPSLPAGLDFDPVTRMLSGTPAEGSASAETTYTYTAKDVDEDAVTLTFTITIREDLMPGFDALSLPSQFYVEGIEIAPFELPGATGGDGTLIYSIVPSLPAGLDFDPVTRVLSGRPDEGTAVDAATYTYTATDEDKDAVTLTLTITIQDDRVPTFDTSVPAQVYIEGVAITPFRLPEAKNGNGTLSYSLTPPAGLRFDPETRMLSGTPAEGSASAETDYTYTATDADKDAVALKFTITIQVDVMPTFGSSSVPAQFYQVGREIATLTLPRATDGNGSLTYSLTLPDGLSFDADGRTISGTPTTEAAAADYTLRVTDEDGDTDELVIRITVRASNFAPITLSPAATLEVSAGATSAVVELSSTVAWQATESETWIESIMPESGTNTSATITLGFAANTGAARTGKVIFTGSAVEVELMVTQLSSVFSEGLIPVRTFEQLNAMRYDMNTDGEVDDAANASDYAEAFPNVVYAAGKYTGYALTRNLDFNEATHYEDASNMTAWAKGAGTGMGWDPIGYYVSAEDKARFKGTFDGKGHTISHLFINRTLTHTWGTVGLFGHAITATIQNLGLVDPEIKCRSTANNYLFTGGIVGRLTFFTGTISQLTNCYVSGGSINAVAVASGYAVAGGMAGTIRGTVVSGCYTSGVSVTHSGAINATGGIAATVYKTEVSECYVSGGSITASSTTNFADGGGMIGNCDKSEVTGCYVAGVDITNTAAAAYTGGIIGLISSSVISGCSVSRGSVTSVGASAASGGIVGRSTSKTGISGCSVSEATIQGGQNSGGIVGWHTNLESLSITACYVSGGTVKGRPAGSAAGGILGDASAPASILACYVFDVNISAAVFSGSIVGGNNQVRTSGSVTACYAGGRDYTNVIASGKLVVTNSYYEASGTSNTDDADPSVQAKTASALQAPTAYGSAATDLYADWDVDLDDNSTNDDPWDFGTGSQYPVLKVIDANRDGTIDAVDDVAAQRN